MDKLLKGSWATFVLLIWITPLLGARVQAQTSTSGSGSLKDSAGHTGKMSFGWQVDHGTKTTTFTGGAQFNLDSNTTCCGDPIAVNVPAQMITIHEVHGNITLTVPTGATVNGSIIVQLLAYGDMDGGNAIVYAKMEKVGSGNVTVPVSGTFPTPLTVSPGASCGGQPCLHWLFYVDNPGQQIVNVALVMN